MFSPLNHLSPWVAFWETIGIGVAIGMIIMFLIMGLTEKKRYYKRADKHSQGIISKKDSEIKVLKKQIEIEKDRKEFYRAKVVTMREKTMVLLNISDSESENLGE